MCNSTLWRTRLGAALAGAVILAGGVAGSAGAQTTVPGVSSIAVNDDATALLTNPAALCRSVPMGAYLGYERMETGDLQIATGLLAGPGFGIGYVGDGPEGGPEHHRLLIGTGGGGGRAPFSLGFRGVYEWSTTDGRETAWRWDMGFLWRPSKRVSMGAMGYDLNQATFADTTYKRSYGLGIALRPLPDTMRDRLTLYGDMRAPDDSDWRDEATIHTGFWIEPVRGIALGAAIDGPLDGFGDERTFSVGARIDFLNASALGGIFLDRDNEVERHAAGIHFTPARQATFAPQKTLTSTKISGVYGDATQRGLPLPIIGGPSFASVRPVLESLENARKDPHVRGVLIDLETVQAGALADEIRASIHAVRKEGKPVVCFAKNLHNRTQLYIASACDRIVMDEMGSAVLLGVRFDIPYFGEMLDSAGVRFEKVARGKYKTAFEPFVLDEPSEGMVESINSILDDREAHQLGLISDERRIERGRLEDLVSGKWWSPEEALTHGLVDSIGDERAAKRILARLAGMEGEPSPKSARGWTYPDRSWADGKKVVVVWLDGAIVDGKSSGGLFSENTIGSETVVPQLRGLADRKDVAAVVLRIDSGGGSALASDEIYRAVAHLKKKGKKVVSSMSRVAGSGGYYIACNSDRIIAEPTTITGSIGVLAVKPDLTGFHDRKRIHVATFQRGDWMGLFSSNHRLTDEERTHIQTGIDRIYERFLDRVAAGRGMSPEAIDAVGQGRIWTGRQAMEHGLIDGLGGLPEAIETARELAGLTEEAKVEHQVRRAGSWFARMLMGVGIGGDRSYRMVDAIEDPSAAWLLGRSLEPGRSIDEKGIIRLENPLLDILAVEP